MSELTIRRNESPRSNYTNSVRHITLRRCRKQFRMRRVFWPPLADTRAPRLHSDAPPQAIVVAKTDSGQRCHNQGFAEDGRKGGASRGKYVPEISGRRTQSIEHNSRRRRK